MKYLVGFARFWYDFIVGDSWVLAAAGAAVLAVGYLLTEYDAGAAAEVALPLLAIAGIAASLPRR